MPNVKNNISAQETRRRLIEAAGEVFAEYGLHAATTKEITARAGVNAAAINYHFSDKFELYAAVVRYALSLCPVSSSDQSPTCSPEQRLRNYVTDMIDDLYSPDRPDWRAPLLAHEFVQPTAALEAVIEELIRPRANLARSIVRDLLGPQASEEQVIRATLSVGAQCFFYLYQREIIRRLYPEFLQHGNNQAIVDHITDFSLAALRGLRKQHKSSY